MNWPRFKSGPMMANSSTVINRKTSRRGFAVFQYIQLFIYFEVHVYVIVLIRTENLEESGYNSEKKSPELFRQIPQVTRDHAG